ncbi:hypothetical protein Taro_001346 [Colocasia esculenta]|uniref:Uncharacterized protein n=1 Tax=Colocasia esculenta TaxID=4460 RepID=A0A843TAR6_COLES|nr:hypothetical protein [Colocasia esculenta]
MFEFVNLDSLSFFYVFSFYGQGLWTRYWLMYGQETIINSFFFLLFLSVGILSDILLFSLWSCNFSN